MKLLVLTLLLFLVADEILGQKQVQEVFDAAGVKEIEIFAEEVFKIVLVAGNTGKIVLKSSSEGEYYNAIRLETEMLQGRLIIRSRFPEILQGGFDKLSANKVFSLEMSLEIPEGLLVLIESGSASLKAIGKYDNLRVELKRGDVNLQDFTGDAVVNTYFGNVHISTPGARVEAFSRSGSIKLANFPASEYQIKITSVKGDIEVVKTK